MEFVGRVQKDGSLDFGLRNNEAFRHWRKNNVGALLKITPVLPESDKQRRFLEGAVIPLVTYYQEGMDHRNADDCRRVREWLKAEFNGQIVHLSTPEGIINGHRIAKSTKGREALNAFLEKVVEWLQDNYSPPLEALDPAHFKLWRDTVMDGPTNYIDWLIERRILN